MSQFMNGVLLACMLICARGASAAVLDLEAGAMPLSVGDTVEVALFLDTEGETVNAVEGTFVFPHELFEFAEVHDGDSMVTFWAERPGLTRRGNVHFSGITPGGFAHAHAPILRVVLRATTEGAGSLTLSDARLLRHDGLGTDVPATMEPLAIEVGVGVPHEYEDSTESDIEIPEAFMPEVQSDPDVFDGALFLVFATEDKGSGIDRYEVREGFLDFFRIAESPYRLRHQLFDRKITVKAVDRAGNERLAVLYPPNSEPYRPDVLTSIAILVACVLLVSFIFRYWRRRSVS